ncbi:MAG TPA: hypothetical protein DCL15_11890 [Chloroflexi bacterium]|nr:hypothetical protein [Chloroflexota bacterium]HHW87606.1 hypothetical protein [Chloroflexota bacterium]
MAQGLQQGLLDDIRLALELRSGIDGLRLLPEIIKSDDISVLKAAHEAIRLLRRQKSYATSSARHEQFFVPTTR